MSEDLKLDDLIAKRQADFKLNMPKASDWECELFGMNKSIVIRPHEGDVPNAFWRFMQWICFGNRWRKIK